MAISTLVYNCGTKTFVGNFVGGLSTPRRSTHGVTGRGLGMLGTTYQGGGGGELFRGFYGILLLKGNLPV